MPLNADNETVSSLHTLNETVVGASGHSKVVPDLIDALVVVRVHCDTTGTAHPLRDLRRGINVYIVVGAQQVLEPRTMRPDVAHVSFQVGGEGPAARHIEQLQAAADRQRRSAETIGRPQGSELILIANPIDDLHGGIRRITTGHFGRHIDAAEQNEAICKSDEL